MTDRKDLTDDSAPGGSGATSPEPDLVVTAPKEWAAGVPGVLHAMGPALAELGVGRSLTLLTKLNQQQGVDCMSCAWPDPTHRKAAEFCENGAKAVTWEATPLTVPSSFWAENSLSELLERDEYWLGQQGRLVEPVHKPAGSDHYRPVSWEEAFAIIGERLASLESPDQAAFYTSGRASNEAAFLYQLFVRAYGTNNLPDCSNMCHESTGAALTETLGIGGHGVVARVAVRGTGVRRAAHAVALHRVGHPRPRPLHLDEHVPLRLPLQEQPQRPGVVHPADQAHPLHRDHGRPLRGRRDDAGAVALGLGEQQVEHRRVGRRCLVVHGLLNHGRCPRGRPRRRPAPR